MEIDLLTARFSLAAAISTPVVELVRLDIGAGGRPAVAASSCEV